MRHQDTGEVYKGHWSKRKISDSKPEDEGALPSWPANSNKEKKMPKKKATRKATKKSGKPKAKGSTLKYPRGFNAHSPPQAPSKPREPIEFFENVCNEVEVARLIYEDNTRVNIEDMPKKEGYLLLQLSHDSGYGEYSGCSYSASLVFLTSERVKNPKYEAELKKYEKAMVKYKAQLKEHREKKKEWKAFKSKWDAEVEEQEKERRRKQYEELKKEFG